MTGMATIHWVPNISGIKWGEIIINPVKAGKLNRVEKKVVLKKRSFNCDGFVWYWRIKGIANISNSIIQNINNRTKNSTTKCINT